MPSSDLDQDEILRRGTPTRAVVVRSQWSGLLSRDGVGLYTIVLNVTGHDGARQVTIGSAVPELAVPCLRPGTDLPVRVLADDVRAVAVDFDLTVREAAPG